MAQGIFDFLQSEAAQPGLMALALGGGGLGQLAGGLVQQQAALEDRKYKRRAQDMQNQLIQAQMANYQSEIRNRDLAAVRDARRQAYLEGGDPSGPAPGAPPGVIAAGAAGQPGTPGTAAGGAAPRRGGLLDYAQELGIDPRQIRLNMALNDGKDIPGMFNDRTKPNWQNINGNLVNVNAPGFQGGLQGGMSASADGKVTMWQPDGRGGLVAGAVPGATDAFAAFENLKNRSAASYNPGRPVLGADGRTYGQSQLDEIGGGATRAPSMAPGGRAGPTNPAERGMAADVAGVRIDPQREIAQVQLELKTMTNPQDRAAATAYLQRLQAQAGAQAPTAAPGPAGALDFSPQEKAEQKAAETRANNTAAADVVRDTSRQTDAKRSSQFLPTIDRAITLLKDKDGPTSSLIGVGVDAALGAFGKSTKGAELGEQLSALSGWLTSNVPRMEGPQSDRDAQNYAIMAGRVGDNSKPINTRLAAANEIRNLQLKYASLNGIEVPGTGGGGAQGGQQQEASKTFPTPPAQAINDLKLRGRKASAQFDAVFGPGAAERAFGGQ